MKIHIAKKHLVLGCAVLAGLFNAVAQADVMLEEKLSVEGSGIMSMANMSGTTKTAISGKRSKTESDLQMESRLVRMFARGAGQTTEIVLLDADKVYEIDAKKRQYREISLADRRAQMEKAAEQARQAAAQQPAPTGIDESQCEWSEPKVDVTRPGTRSTVAGFSAEQVNVVSRQSCKDRKTGNVCDIALSLEEWIAPDFDAGQEALQFSVAYAQQMGVASMTRDSTERAEAFMGRYKAAWSKVADQMRNIKGYPVKTSFALGLGGAGCAGASGGTSASSDSSTANPSPTAVGAQIAGALFGRKKKEAAAAAPASSLPGLDGMWVPLRVRSELITASRETLPADTFSVPAGFRKIAE
jgi:hypothetical protein